MVQRWSIFCFFTKFGIFSFQPVFTDFKALNTEVRPDLSLLVFLRIVYWKRSTIALLLPLIGSETCCYFQANGSLEHCCIVTNQMKWSPPTKMNISMRELYQILKKQRGQKTESLFLSLLHKGKFPEHQPTLMAIPRLQDSPGPNKK